MSPRKLQPRRIRRFGLILWLAALAAALTAPVQALAHPHVRLTYQIEPRLEDGAIVGLRVRWTMDPMTSVLVIRGIDVNRNGIVDEGELAEFARGNRTLLEPHEYFLRVADADGAIGFRIDEPLHAYHDAADAAIRLRFGLSLQRPVTGSLSVRFFDRTWYVRLSADDPPLADAAREGHRCSAVLSTHSEETEGWGTQAIPELSVSCPAARERATAVGAPDDVRSDREPGSKEMK